MSRRTDRQAGFTLIEVLAALLVTAALVAVVLPFAGGLVERWRAGQGAVDAADAWMQAQARLSDDIAEALPMMGGPDGQRRFVFRADPRALSFVRPALGGTEATGLETVSYTVTVDGSGERIVRRAQAFSSDPAAGEAAPGPSVALLSGPFAFRFAVVGPDGVRQDRWSNAQAMPVRVELAIAASQGPAPPVTRMMLPIVARATILLSVGH